MVNARTLEIFRQAGLDMDAIIAVAKDPADAGHVNFVTRLNGQLIGRLPFERQGPEVLEQTPTPLRNISQHRLEPHPRRRGRRHGRRRPALRHRVAGQHAGRRRRHLDAFATWPPATPSRSAAATCSRADGAGSRVRKSLGIDMVGPPSLQSFIAIHIAADLRAMVADRLGVLHFVMDPAVTGVFVAHDIDREWVFMVELRPRRGVARRLRHGPLHVHRASARSATTTAALDVLGAGVLAHERPGGRAHARRPHLPRR